MRDRCFRTVFISPMLAPLRSSARVTACLSASVSPLAGAIQLAASTPGSLKDLVDTIGRGELQAVLFLSTEADCDIATLTGLNRVGSVVVLAAGFMAMRGFGSRTKY